MRCPIAEYLQKLVFVFAFANHLILVHVEPAIYDLVLLGARQASLHFLAAQVLEEAGHEAFLTEARFLIGILRGMLLGNKWLQVPLNVLDIL